VVEQSVELFLDGFDGFGEPGAAEHLAQRVVVEGAAEPDVRRDGEEEVVARKRLALPGTNPML
jgi:hypothetical protein